MSFVSRSLHAPLNLLLNSMMYTYWKCWKKLKKKRVTPMITRAWNFSEFSGVRLCGCQLFKLLFVVFMHFHEPYRMLLSFTFWFAEEEWHELWGGLRSSNSSRSFCPNDHQKLIVKLTGKLISLLPIQESRSFVYTNVHGANCFSIYYEKPSRWTDLMRHIEVSRLFYHDAFTL